MQQAATQISVETTARNLIEITRQVAGWVAGHGIATGLLTVYIQHTSASLTIQENADPDVQRDLIRFLDRLVPEDDSLYIHDAEGPDDMPAHIKAALTQTSLSIPIVNGRLVLGAWQGIYIFEHRARSHSRRVTLHLIGES
jgi:secondary thiamine-phosphate synthase enzyme